MNTDTNPSPTASDANRHHLAYLLAVGMAMGALLWTLSAEDPWGWLFPRYVDVALDQHAYRVPEQRLESLSRTRPDWLSTAEAQALDRLEQSVTRELDRLFDRVHGRVPEFADWYYSVTGAGLRLLAAIPNPFWRDRGDFLTHAVSQRLFPDDAWQAELDALDRAVGEVYSRELSALEGEWLGWLARELAPYRQEGPRTAQDRRVDLNERVQAHVAGILNADRIGIQAAAGLGAGALLARSAVARVNAGAASARAAARLAGRGTAASGAVTCGMTGPLAAGCAVVVFTGVTLGTEWALLKTDELLNRDDLERAMHRSVDALRETMMAEYGRPFLAIFESNMETLSEGIRGSLRPIDRIRPRDPG